MDAEGVARLKLLNENEVAELIGLNVTTLRKWRQTGTGPAYLKIEGAIRYDLEDLAEYMTAARAKGARLRMMKRNRFLRSA